MITVVIFCKRELFRFESYEDWDKNEQSKFEDCPVSYRKIISIDDLGRSCVYGRDFKLAEKQNAYPVKVYEVE